MGWSGSYRRPRKFTALDPDCRLCDARQLANVLFDPQVQLLQLRIAKHVETHQVHGHGPGLVLVAWRRLGSTATEYVDGVTILQALERALAQLNPHGRVE